MTYKRGEVIALSLPPRGESRGGGLVDNTTHYMKHPPYSAKGIDQAKGELVYTEQDSKYEFNEDNNIWSSDPKARTWVLKEEVKA